MEEGNKLYFVCFCQRGCKKVKEDAARPNLLLYQNIIILEYKRREKREREKEKEGEGSMQMALI